MRGWGMVGSNHNGAPWKRKRGGVRVKPFRLSCLLFVLFCFGFGLFVYFSELCGSFFIFIYFFFKLASDNLSWQVAIPFNFSPPKRSLPHLEMLGGVFGGEVAQMSRRDDEVPLLINGHSNNKCRRM